ncbi:MAG TPA: sulfotransferase, partial [Candidatus Binataceae bacterium]|nr:sulfotransferase [Candidatus Binataceae bacterium]
VSFEEAVDRYREIDEMNRYGHHLRAWREVFGPENVLTCLYDDLEADPQGYLDRVCDFVGVARFRLDSAAAVSRVNTFASAPRSRKLAQNARHARDWLQARRAYRIVSFLDRVGVWRLCFEGGEEFAPLQPELEARLKERYRPEVEDLERLIGRDLSAWKAVPGAAPARAANDQ